MLRALAGLARPMLFALEPEAAHEVTLRALEHGIYPRASSVRHPVLEVPLWGLTFPNPLGVAAGFDKDARVPDAVLGLGCGYAEIGTTTPRPQPGNPSPRVFRLISERAVINRLGFNNAGHAKALERLKARPARGIVGVNIGANKQSADRAADYVAGIEAFYDVASYFTVNISSPNTPGLRDLQAPAALDELLGRVMAGRAAKVAAGSPSRPIVVKVAPDLAEEDVGPITEALVRHGVDGIAVSNTTLARPHGLADRAAAEAGGLSGRPLFHRSTVMLARVYQATGGKVPLIGIGGIDSGETALAKIEAGASLLQLYTGLIYEGPGLIGRITARLAEACQQRGVSSIMDLVGTRAAEWAAKPLD
ncbi:diguanylate cyclase [Hyphomicrobium nitrativorans NL23]|uniref:Dihydroorotate dehydrogenase (quinone) n=1 Tax=Hyphomicrobium nitrativorans NL23 TaxID=1029756 RepID=V5S9M5_9HYPH|nr:quinone-dependent dihydroorotate dehydrogenase [Hyphomicrobium nitrativorans]AHB47167.1 diguanylate cyclase [Hyphomicrobium nitrativorans NL23]